MSFLQEVRQRLEKASIPSADLEAELLVACSMGITRTALLAGAEPDASQRAALEALIQRRLGREPLAYLTGRAEFFGHTLTVGPGVHLPRPSTETLVEEALRRIGTRAWTVVDVGTGSGNIALAIRRACPSATVIATDVDPTALEYARRNLAGVEILQGDLLTPLDARKTDLILSNPPYVARSEWSMVDPEVHHEPRIALDGGPDGLEVIRRLISTAPAHLRPGGALLIEVGFSQADFASKQLMSSNYRDLVTLPDAEGIPRVVGGTPA
jgi:release factor glutamine methyltransferase